MNIFYLDRNIKKNAAYHCDKHVVKMILETAQLLCSVYWANGIEAPYKKTHVNHPCAIWARESAGHFIYLINLGRELGKEYNARYNKHHKSLQVIDWCADNSPSLRFNKMEFTEPPKCMPDKYKTEDTVESYRRYYISDKKDIAQWKYSEIPNWFKIQ